MPELPELEVTKDRLRLALTGRVAAGALVRSPVALKTVTPPLESLVGRHIRSVSRFGKVICIAIDGSTGSSLPPPTTSSSPPSTSALPSATSPVPTSTSPFPLSTSPLYLCIHLMLSGRFAFGPTKAPLNRLHAFVLSLDRDEDLRVVEDSTKHRLSIYLVTDPHQIDIVARLGPDPLAPEFTLARFKQALARRSRTLKRFLTDQSAIAGIGNCFSDEILLEARLSPFTLSTAVKPEETIRLYMAVKKVLQDATVHLRALDRLPERKDRTFLRVHDRLDQPCPACSTPVKRVSYSESTLYYCPTCQTGGRELADRRFSKFLK
ncbi:Fpg/Nei family DNA glycosylase [candidate division WOR-3 bacterium]|uniref:Fpg/Nei family DNA glycosylase n=1 Tax=candidate division WOR-3 bacterium TaxID=2052148 RepID=A0A938BS28_UNCW3|nr:Fpg/Nei family DNA glycosylase [candidate division WOR-3 bacterium]